LSKLEWAAESGSERQIADAAGIVSVVGAQLDLDYIDRWARELGVESSWNSLRPGENRQRSG
jgi:hypothetical protein